MGRRRDEIPATKKPFFVMFLDRSGRIGDWMHDKPISYTMYDGILDHGNEWYDLLYEGYEMWISSMDGKKPKFEPFVEEIKLDYERDAEYVEVGHKYYGKWLVLKLTSHTDVSPEFGNCEFEPEDAEGKVIGQRCDRVDSPKRSDILALTERYLYLCDEHYVKEQDEIRKWHDQNEVEKLRVHNEIGHGGRYNNSEIYEVNVCDYCGEDISELAIRKTHNENTNVFHQMLRSHGTGIYRCDYCEWKNPDLKQP